MLLTETEKTQARGEQLRKAEETLAVVEDADIIVYTDGSAEGGVTGGGAGVTAYRAGEQERLWSGLA